MKDILVHPKRIQAIKNITKYKIHICFFVMIKDFHVYFLPLRILNINKKYTLELMKFGDDESWFSFHHTI